MMTERMVFGPFAGTSAGWSAAKLPVCLLGVNYRDFILSKEMCLFSVFLHLFAFWEGLFAFLCMFLH